MLIVAIERIPKLKIAFYHFSISSTKQAGYFEYKTMGLLQKYQTKYVNM
jgi:hypothetical protein